jgi:succinylarginine dihydrolase
MRCQARRPLRLFVQQSIVLGVRADPDPSQIVGIFNCQRSVVQANANRPELTNFLEVQRRVPRICAKQFVAAIGELLNLGWQASVTIPETRRRPMSHRSVQRPACRSACASSASQSNRPAATSASSCRSHSWASNSANQARNAARSSGESLWTAASTSSIVLISKS